MSMLRNPVTFHRETGAADNLLTLAQEISYILRGPLSRHWRPTPGQNSILILYRSSIPTPSRTRSSRFGGPRRFEVYLWVVRNGFLYGRTMFLPTHVV